MNFDINWLATVLTGIAAFMLGSLWYSSRLFGNPWMRAMGLTLNDIKDSGKPMGPALLASLASSLLMCLVMAILLKSLGTNDWQYGVGLGALVYVGFNGASFFRLIFWEDRPITLFLISGGYDLCCFMLAGGLLVLWK